MLISWRVGCSKFTQSQAERFCADNNMVSSNWLLNQKLSSDWSFYLILTSDWLLTQMLTSDWLQVAVSLDSRAKEDHFLGLVAKDRQRYFWTGGKVNNGNIR